MINWSFGFIKDKEEETDVYIYDENGNRIEKVTLFKIYETPSAEEYYAIQKENKEKEEYEELFSLYDFLEEYYANDTYPIGHWIAENNIGLIIRKDILDDKEKREKIFNYLKEIGEKEFGLKTENIEDAIKIILGEKIPIPPIPILKVPEAPQLRAPAALGFTYGEDKEKDKELLSKILEENPIYCIALTILQDAYEEIQKDLGEVKLEDIEKVLLKFAISVADFYEKIVMNAIFGTYRKSEKEILFNSLIKSKIKSIIKEILEEKYT